MWFLSLRCSRPGLRTPDLVGGLVHGLHIIPATPTAALCHLRHSQRFLIVSSPSPQVFHLGDPAPRPRSPSPAGTTTPPPPRLATHSSHSPPAVNCITIYSTPQGPLQGTLTRPISQQASRSLPIVVEWYKAGARSFSGYAPGPLSATHACSKRPGDPEARLIRSHNPYAWPAAFFCHGSLVLGLFFFGLQRMKGGCANGANALRED